MSLRAECLRGFSKTGGFFVYFFSKHAFRVSLKTVKLGLFSTSDRHISRLSVSNRLSLHQFVVRMSSFKTTNAEVECSPGIVLFFFNYVDFVDFGTAINELIFTIFKLQTVISRDCDELRPYPFTSL